MIPGMAALGDTLTIPGALALCDPTVLVGKTSRPALLSPQIATPHPPAPTDPTHAMGVTLSKILTVKVGAAMQIPIGQFCPATCKCFVIAKDVTVILPLK
jgi:hypothetical protein